MTSKQQVMRFMAKIDTFWADRYSRQIRFAPIGKSGQEKLSNNTVLIIGSGALGASLAQHMTRMGVKELRLVDRDFVEPSNLQRQMLFFEKDAEQIMPKSEAAAEKLRQMNKEVQIDSYVLDVHEGNIDQLLEGVDLVLDGTDNILTRLITSEACFRKGIPFVFGGVAGSQGMSALLLPGETACLRCIIGPQAEHGETDNCDTIGVLSPAVEMVTALQAIEALKWLTGNYSVLRRSWIRFNIWDFGMHEAKLPDASRDCDICGKYLNKETDRNSPKNSFAESDKKSETKNVMRTAILCGRDTVQVTLTKKIELDKLQANWTEQKENVLRNPFLVRLQVEEKTSLTVFADGRVFVQGISDTKRAIQLCNKYIMAFD